MSLAELHVHSVGGALLCAVETNAETRMRDVKGHIQQVTGVPVSEQQVAVGGTSPGDEELVLAVLKSAKSEGDSYRASGSADGRRAYATLVRKDPERIRALERVSDDGTALTGLEDRFKEDRDVVLTAVRQSGAVIAHASPDLRADRAVVLEAIRRQPASLWSAAPELRTDLDFLVEAAWLNERALVYAPLNLQEKVRAKLKEKTEALMSA